MQIEIWYYIRFFKACDIFCRIKHKKPQKNQAKKKRESNKNFYTHFIVQYTICWSFNGSLDLWRTKIYKLGDQVGQNINFNQNIILFFFSNFVVIQNISKAACKTTSKTYSSYTQLCIYRYIYISNKYLEKQQIYMNRGGI